MTHDYKRNGTTTLFAALNVLEGTVIGRCMQRHRHQEFIRFLNAIEAAVPAGKIVHVILDNYAAHKHPKVRRLARPPSALRSSTSPRPPAPGSTPSRASSPSSPSAASSAASSAPSSTSRPPSTDIVAEANHDPKPFLWTADPDKIIAAVKRGHQVLNSIH